MLQDIKITPTMNGSFELKRTSIFIVTSRTWFYGEFSDLHSLRTHTHLCVRVLFLKIKFVNLCCSFNALRFSFRPSGKGETKKKSAAQVMMMKYIEVTNGIYPQDGNEKEWKLKGDPAETTWFIEPNRWPRMSAGWQRTFRPHPSTVQQKWANNIKRSFSFLSTRQQPNHFKETVIEHDDFVADRRDFEPSAMLAPSIGVYRQRRNLSCWITDIYAVWWSWQVVRPIYNKLTTNKILQLK
jgi:hypothetical protein